MISFAILMSTLAAGAAYAGAQGAPSTLAVSLPQPCTIFICTAGLAFCRSITKRLP
jgi:hypothetical protein